jgi:glycogen operon protein
MSGYPEPLGVVPAGTGINVAVYAPGAEGVELCLFDDQDTETRISLDARTGDVWHRQIDGVQVGARYGLRAQGQFAPELGLRFDATKLLVDPFALALDRPFALVPALLALPDAGIDTAFAVPKAIVVPQAPQPAPRPPVPWADTVIYEASVRGLTMRHPDIPPDIRGTFTALAHPAMVAHLRGLGCTTLELLPCAAWIDERHLPALGLANAWGYNPIALCAPDPRLAPGGWADVRAASDALAAAGIELILDVVFNHTGEGDEFGPTLSLRGLGNRPFYWLEQDDPARYRNFAGTGNALRLDRAFGVRLAMEAMRAWMQRGGIAGFRFDLATVLARGEHGFDANAPLFAAIDSDPLLRQAKLIAEPWDCAPDGYRPGEFPAGFGEWNDAYRDTLRRFWRGDPATRGALAQRLAGSADRFGARQHPSRGINYITAHDGFTLADLVSHARKHNGANGEDNRDGTEENFSWNHGIEGATNDPAIVSLRLADQRALLALLFCARGTPMLSAGSELGQSQHGNNNAYAQDNEIGWIKWGNVDQGLKAWISRLTALRRAHPALRVDRFLTGDARDGPYPDVEWLDFACQQMTPAAWDDPAGTGLQVVLTDAASGDRVLLAIHRGAEPASLVLAPPRDGHAWRIAADSAAPSRADLAAGDAVTVTSRSVVLFAEEKSASRRHGAHDAAVAALAEAAGIAPSWHGIDGIAHAVGLDTKRALLAAMGLQCATDGEVRESLWHLAADQRAPVPRVHILREDDLHLVPVGAPLSWLAIEHPDGQVTPAPVRDRLAHLPPLARGRYRLHAGAASGELILVPRRCHQPALLAQPPGIFGFAAQLYSLRRAQDGGIGDFSALAALGEIATRAGAAMIAINPLHALFPGDRDRASPYQPSDRRFIDPLMLDPGGQPAAGDATLIDYKAVWASRLPALHEIVGQTDPAALNAFIRAGGQALHDFAVFEALSEAQGHAPWQRWAEALRDPRGPGVARFAQDHEGRVRHHACLQYLCDRKFAAAAARAPGLGICRDLAVGAAPDGAEAWAGGARFAHGVSIGAPPDDIAPQGQVWGLPPPNPHQARAEAYRGFAELLAANMRHAGALRIDHVLGLARLFWVPAGADGRDGAYVANHLPDLLGVLALQSEAQHCLVIGEDLGTVPHGLRDVLAETGIFRTVLLPFERDGAGFVPPARYTKAAVACATTHDLPPLAGWWEGVEIAERAALGRCTPAVAAAEQAARVADKAALMAAIAGATGTAFDPDGPYSPEIGAAILGFLVAGGARIVLAPIDDLCGEAVGVNLPGTDRERPNWRRRLGVTLEALAANPYFTAGIAALRREHAG